VERDIKRLKNAYLNYIEAELERIIEGYPIDEVGDLVYELYTKYDERGVDYDFEELMDRIVSVTQNKLRKSFKELKDEILRIS